MDDFTKPTPPVNPFAPPKKEGLQINFRLPISKKVLIRVILPIVIVGLLVTGLIQQGFIRDWINRYERASAALIVTTADQKPIENAQIVFGSQLAVSNASGQASLDSLVAGQQEMTVSKTGFLTLKQTVKLKRGQNNLGTVTLVSAPIPKTTVSLKISDYITEEAIIDATATIDDLTPVITSGAYQFADTPVGSHRLTVTKGSYDSFSSMITVEAKTVGLDPVKLVKTGSIVFESNRDAGLRGIFTANYDGSNQQSLVTRSGTFEDYSPILGPNQKKVLFTSTRDGVKQPSGGAYTPFLYVVDLDGKSLVKIGESSDSYSAKWSPDGGFIGYFNYDNDAGKNKLFTYDVVKKALHSFEGYSVNGDVAFSGSGQVIAFTGSADSASTTQSLFYANSDGTGIKKVDDQSAYALEFTAEGKLRYTYYDTFTRKDRHFEYDPVANTKTEISAPAIDRLGAILSPSKKLRAYVSTRDGKSNVYISDADGKNEKKLTDLNRVVPGDILWATDSSFVMFNYRSDNESARYLVATNNQAKAKKIVDINLTYAGGYN